MKEIGRYTNIKRKVANRHLLKSRAFPRYITNAWPSEPGGPGGATPPLPILVDTLTTPSIAEIIWVKNVRAIVVCGFLSGPF